MSEARQTKRELLAGLLSEQCDLLPRLGVRVDAQLEAVNQGNLELYEKLTLEIEPLTLRLEELQGEIPAVEAQLVALYQGLDAGEHRQEMETVLNLLAQRSRMMQELALQQQGVIEALESYIDGLTKEGRDLNQTVNAFHGYRKAANLDSTLLNVRK